MTTAAGRPTASPTGQQWVIGSGDQEVVITEVGATLRSYTVAGEPVLQGFGPDEWSHAGHGQVLAPWPNRLADGRYEFGGVQARAALDEPDRGNAIHGLVRWLAWSLEAHAQNVVTVRVALHPTPGYPWRVDLRLEYRLARDGLAVTTSATNRGDGPAPFGIGFHPYLTVGADRIDTARLTLPATNRVVTDARGLPTGERFAVAGTEYDFRAGRAIGPTRLDTVFSDLTRDSDGMAVAELADPVSSRAVSLWADDHFRYLVVFTADTLADPAARRSAVAVEPMTCPPDALRTGRDLVVLEPGITWSGRWGVRPG